MTAFETRVHALELQLQALQGDAEALSREAIIGAPLTVQSGADGATDSQTIRGRLIVRYLNAIEKLQRPRAGTVHTARTPQCDDVSFTLVLDDDKGDADTASMDVTRTEKDVDPSSSAFHGERAIGADVDTAADEEADVKVLPGTSAVAISISISGVSVPLTAEAGLDIATVLTSQMFQDWRDALEQDPLLTCRAVHFQSLDMFGPKPGFCKFKADVYIGDNEVPGIVFMRGGAVAVLIILECDGKEYTILTRQPRASPGTPLNFALLELPLPFADAAAATGGGDAESPQGVQPWATAILHRLPPGACHHRWQPAAVAATGSLPPPSRWACFVSHFHFDADAGTPIGTSDLPELPAGMLDESQYLKGQAIEEIKQECGLVLKEADLISLTTLAFGENRGKWRGVFPSAGGCDEWIHLFVHRKRVRKEFIDKLQGRLTGLVNEGEMIKLHLIPTADIWRLSPDCKAHSAMYLYNELLNAKLLQKRADGKVCQVAQRTKQSAAASKDEVETKAGLTAADVDKLAQRDADVASTAGKPGAEVDVATAAVTSTDATTDAVTHDSSEHVQHSAANSDDGSSGGGSKNGSLTPPTSPSSGWQKMQKVQTVQTVQNVQKMQKSSTGSSKPPAIVDSVIPGVKALRQFQVETRLGPGLQPIPVTAEPGVDCQKVLECAQFRQWARAVAQDRQLRVNSIHIQSVWRRAGHVQRLLAPLIVPMLKGSVAILTPD